MYNNCVIAPEEKNIVKELQRLVDKVEEMKNQRALLMLQLRESLRNDDITEQIALSDDDKSDFSATVDKEIAKHQNIVRIFFEIYFIFLFWFYKVENDEQYFFFL